MTATRFPLGTPGKCVNRDTSSRRGLAEKSVCKGCSWNARTNKEWTAVARKYWAKAALQDRIELRLGPAIPTLQQLEPGLSFDFAFLDAAKTEYDAYYELILPRVRRNGLILFDNMLAGGRLGAGVLKDDYGRAIDALNHKLAGDSRVEAVLLPVADGIQLCRKR